MWFVNLVDRLGCVVRELSQHERYESAVAFAAGFGESREGVAVVSQLQRPGDVLEFFLSCRPDDSDGTTIIDVETVAAIAAERVEDCENGRVTLCRLSLEELVAELGGAKQAGLRLLDELDLEDLENRYGRRIDAAAYDFETQFLKLSEGSREAVTSFMESLYADEQDTASEATEREVEAETERDDEAEQAEADPPADPEIKTPSETELEPKPSDGIQAWAVRIEGSWVNRLYPTKEEPEKTCERLTLRGINCEVVQLRFSDFLLGLATVEAPKNLEKTA